MLNGRIFGGGATAVVLSNMGDNDPAPWEQFAPLLADRGYLVLSYSYRYPLRTRTFTDAMARGTVADLAGAVAYVRGLGATRVVLIGASLGGMAVGKVAGTVGAAAVVILSAPFDLSEYGFVVTPADIAAVTAPKLFVASEQDLTVPIAETRAYFDTAPEPKQFHSFPGDAHGVLILRGEHGDELRRAMIDFLSTHVSV
jgi:fermentation-respiration switch protein FrsA (DUF1100 family)